MKIDGSPLVKRDYRKVATIVVFTCSYFLTLLIARRKRLLIYLTTVVYTGLETPPIFGSGGCNHFEVVLSFREQPHAAVRRRGAASGARF
jgi:hypothetical protein